MSTWVGSAHGAITWAHEGGKKLPVLGRVYDGVCYYIASPLGDKVKNFVKNYFPKFCYEFAKNHSQGLVVTTVGLGTVFLLGVLVNAIWTQHRDKD